MFVIILNKITLEKRTIIFAFTLHPGYYTSLPPRCVSMWSGRCGFYAENRYVVKKIIMPTFVIKQCLASFSPSFVDLVFDSYIPLQAIYVDALAAVSFMTRGRKFLLLLSFKLHFIKFVPLV